VIRQDGRIVAEHPRSFGRGETTYDPWHYVPVLARKPDLGHQCSHAPGRPILHLFSSSRRPRQV